MGLAITQVMQGAKLREGVAWRRRWVVTRREEANKAIGRSTQNRQGMHAASLGGWRLPMAHGHRRWAGVSAQLAAQGLQRGAQALLPHALLALPLAVHAVALRLPKGVAFGTVAGAF